MRLAALIFLLMGGCTSAFVGAGLHADSGSGALLDAGAEDAGQVMDAGAQPDAGSAPDAGVPAAEPSPGCQATLQLPEGVQTLTLNAVERRFIVRLPANYTPSRPWPLVLALHPNGSDATYWDVTTGERDMRAEVRDHALLVIAEARTGDWRTEVQLDRTYFDAVVDRVKGKLCVDVKRIFSMGFSGGGSYSGVLGCYRTDIRAIAVGGAVVYFEPAACVGNPAAWITIGTDELIDARAQYRDFWRTRNGCSAELTPTSPAPCAAYTCPDAARPVQFCEHPGGHIWPNFGTQAAWAFFAQF